MERQTITIMKDVKHALILDYTMANKESIIENCQEMQGILSALQGMLDRMNTLNEISVHTNSLVANAAIDTIKNKRETSEALADIQIMNSRSKRTADEIDRLTNNGQAIIKNALDRLRLSEMI